MKLYILLTNRNPSIGLLSESRESLVRTQGGDFDARSSTARSAENGDGKNPLPPSAPLPRRENHFTPSAPWEFAPVMPFSCFSPCRLSYSASRLSGQLSSNPQVGQTNRITSELLSFSPCCSHRAYNCCRCVQGTPRPPSSVCATCRWRTPSICEDRRSSVEVRSRPRLLFPVRAATITRPFPKPWPGRAARGARRGLREPPFVGG